MDNYLVITYGLPGSGKTTYIEKLEKGISGKFFSPTLTRREKGHKKYSKKQTPKVLKETYLKVLESIETNNTLLESNFIKRETRESLYKLFEDKKTIMLEIKCSSETGKRRMRQRKKNDGLIVDSRNPQKYDELLESYTPVEQEEIIKNKNIIYTEFDSEKGDFKILSNSEKIDKESLKFIETLRNNLIETFISINKI